MTLKEHQCMVHVAPYIFRGPGPVRIWQEKDQETQEVTAIKIYHGTYQQTRTVWMDGRPHPPESALHTWMGFSTGKWEGDTLTVYTTHMKQGWLRRNGLPESDRATLTEHFIKHGDILTRMSMITDPVYLEELAADCAADGRYEFLLVAPPLPVTNAVGTPINPYALK